MKFFHRIPNSLIRCMVARDNANICEDVQFGADGMIETDDIRKGDVLLADAAEKYLRGIANRPGTGVTTDADLNMDAAAEAVMKGDVKKSVEDAQTKLVKAGVNP